MIITSGIVSEQVANSPVRVRSPLQIRTTSPSPTSTLKQVRRKESFLYRTDSSEEYPSPHESIFEAFYFSATNSDESDNRIELITLYPPPGPNDENRGPSTPSNTYNATTNDEVQFLYGHGTMLETITEQKSSAGTNRTRSRTKSLDYMPSFPFLRHQDSFVVTKSPRKKRSFSLDDIAMINRYYHDACFNISKETYPKTPLFVPEVYAQPRRPLHAPPERPPTPPGMASWTAAQLAPPRGRHVQAPPKQSRFQRFFGIPGTGITVVSRLPVRHGPEAAVRGRTVSAPIRGRIAPRFRPPRSVYGPLDQHPFVRAPVAQVVNETSPLAPGQVEGEAELTFASPDPTMEDVRRQKSRRRRLTGHRVRFTPSATARDSEALALRSAIEATSSSAVHPLTPIEALPFQQEAQNTNTNTDDIPEGPCKHRRSRHIKNKTQVPETETTRPSTPITIPYTDLSSYPSSSTSPSRSHPKSRPDGLIPMGPRQCFTPPERPSAVSSSPSSLSVGSSALFDDVETPVGSPTRSPLTRSPGFRESMNMVENRLLSSANSNIPLMSGALGNLSRSSLELIPSSRRGSTSSRNGLREGSEVGKSAEKESGWCWRCKVEKGWEVVDGWLMRGLDGVCFLCCGFVGGSEERDSDGEEVVRTRNREIAGMGFGGRGVDTDAGRSMRFGRRVGRGAGVGAGIDGEVCMGPSRRWMVGGMERLV